ncbi:SDR family NAD(P)-dependent oxidoreductase [Dyella choica]|uniref:SDR family NAD(P)-dependent oxidoreductase n=1 Tax=Dyella choica TaxID=1927959 RepID=A0A432LZI9_9GAMM|nr:SDR family NAD(P)-dependent oxidoreductase [Dyella choica]RUL69178.1 SDR family NAD(P)-dependent oxidoreductase [Dyella choica]
MTPQTILITGATDGLGRALADRFAQSGARLIIHGRSKRRCHEVAQEVSKASGNSQLEICVADFSRLRDVFAMIDQLRALTPTIDLLINNAGIGVEQARTITEDGYESVLQVNYLATYALSLGLAPAIKRACGRVVCVSSMSQAPIDFQDPQYENGWEGPQAYGRSKWAQVAFAAGMAARGGANAPSICSLHPGSFMPTKLVLGKYPVMDSLETGVETVWRVAHQSVSPDTNGMYFDQHGIALAIPEAYDASVQGKLLDLSAQLISKVPGNEIVGHWRDVLDSRAHRVAADTRK